MVGYDQFFEFIREYPNQIIVYILCAKLEAGDVFQEYRRVMWGGVYFCTEWVEEKKRRKSLWGVGLSKAGAGKNLHQLLLWFDKKCVIFCTEMYGK